LIEKLPTVNALLNGTSALFLTLGYVFIRRKQIQRHRAAMITALVVSVIFLISYLAYHAKAGTTRFAGTGWSRPLYFTILWTHTVLAAAVPFLAVITLNHALRSRFDRHRRIARWTWPIWLYVSVTGVVIYLMLYHLWPSR